MHYATFDEKEKRPGVVRVRASVHWMHLVVGTVVALLFTMPLLVCRPLPMRDVQLVLESNGTAMKIQSPFAALWLHALESLNDEFCILGQHDWFENTTTILNHCQEQTTQTSQATFQWSHTTQIVFTLQGARNRATTFVATNDSVALARWVRTGSQQGLTVVQEGFDDWINQSVAFNEQEEAYWGWTGQGLDSAEWTIRGPISTVSYSFLGGTCLPLYTNTDAKEWKKRSEFWLIPLPTRKCPRHRNNVSVRFIPSVGLIVMALLGCIFAWSIVATCCFVSCRQRRNRLVAIVQKELEMVQADKQQQPPPLPILR